MMTTSYRDQQIAARVASGANSDAVSAAWSVDYSAGYSAGQADARGLEKRDYSGANEAWSAGYDRGWTFALAHPVPLSDGEREHLERCGQFPCESWQAYSRRSQDDGTDGSPDESEACPRCHAVSWGQTPDGRDECTRCLYVA